MSTVKVNKIEKRSGSTLTLGGPGTAVTLACGATQTGFGRTGTVDWCTTAKTSPLTGVSGKGYFINTTGGAVTVTLPASPSAGDIVSIADYAGTAGTNRIVIARNGSKFEGTCSCGALNQKREAVTLVYVDGTQGWASVADNTEEKLDKRYVTATGGCVSTVGDYKIHLFNSSSNFVVSNAGNASGSNTVDYLVVAGGGAGSSQSTLNSNYLTGGGGAGGYRESSGAASGGYTRSPLGACVAALAVPAQTYPITVGAGATSGTVNGTPSVFSTITSTGGGSGAAGATPGLPAAGIPGGSGGGGFYGSPNAAGTGNTPPVSPAQGKNGGNGVGSTSHGGGGGGGATVAGSNANPGAGAGGAGATSEITNSSVVRAGGGGGGSGSGGTGGAGGPGGGGAGGAGQPSNGALGGAGTVNTGSGAGGTSDYSSTGQAASSGGSGVVVIRYKFQN